MYVSGILIECVSNIVIIRQITLRGDMLGYVVQRVCHVLYLIASFFLAYENVHVFFFICYFFPF